MNVDNFDPRRLSLAERWEYFGELWPVQNGEDAAPTYSAAFDVRKHPFELASDPFDKSRDAQLNWIDLNQVALLYRAEWPIEHRADIEAWINANAEPLTLVEQAVACPRWGPWSPPSDQRISEVDLLPHGGSPRGMAKLICVAANRHALAQRWDDAFEMNRWVFRLAAHTRQTPLLLCQLVADNIEMLARGQLIAFVARGAPRTTDRVLERVRAALVDPASDAAVRQGESLWSWDYTERHYEWAENPRRHKQFTKTLESMFETYSLLDVFGSPGQPYASLSEFQRAMRSSSLDRAWKTHCRLAELREIWTKRPFHEVWPERFRLADQEAEISKNDPVAHLHYQSMPLVNGPFNPSVANVTTQRRALETILALFRFRESAGSWPERLEQLVPGQLTEMPIDVFSGNPLIYRRNVQDGSFTLYSVGVNQKDDGGITEETEDLVESVRNPRGDTVYWPPQIPEYEEVVEYS